MQIDPVCVSRYTCQTWRKVMLGKLPAAFALIFMMSAAAEAQFTTLQGWVIIPGDKHSDNFEVRITVREGYEPYASTNVSDTGRYMFTNLDLSVGSFDILINVEGYRESRTRLVTLPPNIMRTDYGGGGGNIILIPDPDSRRQAEKLADYNQALLEEYSKGLDAITNKHPELAVSHLEKVVQEIPDFYDAHINLGVVYQDLFRWRDAEREFRSAHELNSESARPLLALGRLFVGEAESEFQSGTKLEVLQSKLSKAREALTDAIMLDAGLAKAHYYLGAVDLRSRSYTNAERELKLALELDPKLFEARYALIWVFADQKLWQAALDNADTFLLENPESAYRAEVAAVRRRVISHLERR